MSGPREFKIRWDKKENQPCEQVWCGQAKDFEEIVVIKKSEFDRLQSAIESALAIKDLWLPELKTTEIAMLSEDANAEISALFSMEQKFLSASDVEVHNQKGD